MYGILEAWNVLGKESFVEVLSTELIQIENAIYIKLHNMVPCGNLNKGHFSIFLIVFTKKTIGINGQLLLGQKIILYT